MGNELSKLEYVEGSKRSRHRLGRGIGSGNGKTAGRGMKGQRSRSGAGLTPGFEGGQMPLQRRLPKRGFTNPCAQEIEIVNLCDIDLLVGVDLVDPALLAQAGLVSGRKPVKVLARGELTKALHVKANAFSAEASRKIEAAGGKVEVI